MIPLPKSVKIKQIAFKNVKLELKQDRDDASTNIPESVHYSILHRGKVLLSEVEGEASSGEILAIIGGSGCGKTLLLRVLSGRPLDENQFIASGTVSLNHGQFHRSGEWHRKISFVQRNDELYPKLTVEEVITYSARLKCRFKSRRELANRVDEIMKIWKLDKLRDVYIEHVDNEMLSIGSRKRVAIAIHTVNYPDVLFLDEPTVGLDPRREESLMEDINTYARSTDSIVIITINPTRMNIYHMFSKMMLLCHGQTVFYGRVQDALWYFQTFGKFMFTRYQNFSDYFIDIVSLKLNESSDFHADLDRLRDSLRSKWIIYRHLFFHEPRSYLQPIPNESSKDWPNSVYSEFKCLVKRELIGQFRDYPPIILNILQRILIFTVLSFIYFQLQNYPFKYGLRIRFGLLIFITVNQASLVLAMLVPAIGYSRAVIERERLAYTYRISSIYLAKIVSEIPLNLITTVMYAFIIYYITGLRSGFDHFLIFLAVLLLEIYAVMGLGFLISCSAKTRQIRDILSILVFLIIFMFGGNQVQNRLDTSWVIRWVQYLSPVFYAYIALLRNELAGTIIQNVAGNSILKEYRADIFEIWFSACMLFGLGTTYFIGGFIALSATTRARRYIF